MSMISINSCKKPLSFSKGNLSFSQDTVLFDTVFTTIGSVTKKFKIYNTSNKTVKIEGMELMGGASSPFRINIDGSSGTQFAPVELEGKDSLFVFVEVTLDPNNATNPIVIEDRIRFRTNGKDQFVELVAWGQDMYFHHTIFSQGIFDFNEGVWPNDKPHVIYGAAIVDSAKSLIIPAGTEIYLHKNALLYVYKGSLTINGTLGNEVTLQGDRLESFYDDVMGQYYGIYFSEALPSSIDYAIIKNGTSGIHLYSENATNTSYTLQLSNTIIQNCASYGLFIYSGAKVKAENCIIAKNGIHSLLVLEGGDFNLNNCHLLGYGTGGNSAAAVGISNYYSNQQTQTTTIASINEGTITNSIIYGNVDHEIAIDTISDVAITLNFDFQYNLIKSETIFTSPIFNPTNNVWNSEPLFMDPSSYDFHSSSTSPMIDAGGPMSTPVDIEGNGRIIPDIGAYEY